MINQFRKMAKSPVALVIVGLLVLAFAATGLTDVFRGGFSDAVVSAGDRKISAREFRQIFDQQLDQFKQQSGQDVTREQAIAQNAHRQLGQALLAETALAEWTRQAGLVPSDKLIVEQLRAQPRFFNPITGAFDQKTYEGAVQERGLTTQRFEETLKDQIATEHLSSGLTAAVRAPRALTALYTAFDQEARDLSWFPLTPAAVGVIPPPTDAQLQAFLNESADRFRSPELRQLTIVPFTLNAVAAGATAPTEADLRKRFDFKKDTLSQAERRTFVQIPARTAADAQRVATALRAGQDFQAVARNARVEAVRVDDKPRSAVGEPAIAQAAFTLQSGQVSEPIRTPLGFAVVKVLTVTPGREVTFEQARPQLEAEARREQATERLYDLVERFTKARDGGASLADAARQVGVQPLTLPAPVTKEGRFPNGQPSGLPPQAVSAAYALEQGGESDVEELKTQGPDGSQVTQYFAVRVDKVAPPALPSLAQARPALTAIWTNRETARRLQQRADELSQRARRGEPLQALAASVGARLETIKSARRAGAPEPVAELVERAFAVRKGDVFVAPGRGAFFIGRVDAVNPVGPSPELAAAVESSRPNAARAVLSDMSQAARARAVVATKAKLDETRLAQALGIDPPAQKGDSKAKK